MATTNNRDVPLTLSVKTVGAESVKELQTDVQALAKQGGDAAPEFAKLADEIAKLGQQSALIEQTRRLGEEITQLALQETEAAAKSRALGTELDALRLGSEALAANEKLAKQALIASQDALFQKRQELARLKNETSSAAKEESAYTDQVKAINAAIIVGKDVLRQRSAEYRDARTASSEAAAEELSFARNVKESTTAAAAAKTQLDARNQALRENLRALNDAGLAATDVASAESKLLTAYIETVGAVDAVKAARDRATRAARDQAREDESIALTQRAIMQQRQAQAKAEADGIIADFDRMKAAERAAAAEAQAAGKAISDAFSTVGVRSVKELQAEIAQVRAAMETLKTSGNLTGRELDTAFNSGNARIRELEAQIRAATGQTTLLDRAGGLLKTTFGQFAAGFSLIEIMQRLGTAFFESNKQIEALRLGLTTVYNSSATAGAQIDFLRKAADKAGVSFGSISDAFVKFSAATKSANIPIGQTNELFAALTKAAGVLGLSGDKVSHMLDALGQMASKGVVSMEELRQQLGDSLPGALSLVAKGLGITDAELMKLVESGGLLARDLFPALTTALKSMGGEVNTMSARWERFKNLLTETATSAGDAGWVDALKGALTGLGTVLGPIAIGFNTIFESIFTGARAAGVAIAAMVNKDFSMLGTELQRLTDESVARQNKLIASYKQFIGVGDEAATSQQGLARAIGGAADKQQAGAQAAAAAAEAQRDQAASTERANSALAALGVTTATAADKAAVAGVNWAKLGAVYGTMKAESEQAVLVSEKLAKAKEIEGKASSQVAELLGSERDKLQAAAEAADKNVIAMHGVTQARTAELTQLIAYRDALVQEAAKLGDVGGERAKQITAVNDTIVAKAAAAEKSKQELSDLQNTALTLGVSRKAYEDNSKALGDLKLARDAAAAALAAAKALEEKGLATNAQVEQATRLAAQAELLYRDALGDAQAALDRKVQAQQNATTVGLAGLELQKAQAKNSEDLFRRLGDEATALQFLIAQKEIDIKITQAKVNLLIAEADASIAKAKADEDEVKRRGNLTDALQSEIDKRIALAEAKKIEASATLEGTKLLQREIDLLREGGVARSGSTSGVQADTAARLGNVGAIGSTADALEKLFMRYKQSSAYSEKQIALLERETAATEKLAAAERARLAIDKEGFSTDKSGNRIVAGGDLSTRTGIMNFLKNAGVTNDSAARQIANQFADSQGNIPYINNPGQRMYGGDTLSYALLKAAEKWTFNPQNYAGGSQPQQSNTVNVKITLPNGTVQTIPTTQAGATALINALQGAQLSSGTLL